LRGRAAKRFGETPSLVTDGLLDRGDACEIVSETIAAEAET